MEYITVISALDLPFTKRGHLPDAFVKISVTGFDYETKVIKRNRDPQWNEETRL
jgi:Ca2+-dependent lipid-binding protein